MMVENWKLVPQDQEQDKKKEQKCCGLLESTQAVRAPA
jgi:hypothetical protein